MQLIFMGTPAFAVPTLKILHDAGHNIIAVYTQPPRPAGRGQKERPSPVQEYAAQHNLPVYMPMSLKNAEIQAEFAARKAEVTVVAAYGLLLPKAILEACPRGCLNVHPSLLPRWRGAAPIQRTLMAGDTETGVTIMQMDDGLDRGDMLAVRRFSIPTEMDAGGLHDTLAELGAQMMLDVLANPPKPTPQSSEGVTYAKKITSDDCRINWQLSAQEIVNQIRGLSPTPGAFFEYQGEKIKIFKATHHPLPVTHPGTVLDTQPAIACGEGALVPLELQRPGKKRMAVAEFSKGFALPVGAILL